MKNRKRKCTYERLFRFGFITDSLRGWKWVTASFIHRVYIRERGWLTDSKSQRKEKRRFVGRMNKIACDFENWSEDSASRCSGGNNYRRQQLMFQIKEEKRVSCSSSSNHGVLRWWQSKATSYIIHMYVDRFVRKRLIMRHSGTKEPILFWFF